jgi:RNA polymerase subunit RPABC4/transcription elongation factor Spt4
MPKELQGITDAIGGIFDSPLVQLGLRALAVYWVIFWLAAAYWAFRDLQLRTDNPVLPYLAAAFIIVFTPVFFLAAIVVYRIVRPHEKSDEVYERTLAQEAMLAEIETVKNCPGCRRRVHDEWIICPTCRTRLNRVCPNCSKLVGLDWSICAWCGKDFERREPVAAGSVISVSAASQAALPEPGSSPVLPAATASDVPIARSSARSVVPRSTSVRPSAGRQAPGSLPER